MAGRQPRPWHPVPLATGMTDGMNQASQSRSGGDGPGWTRRSLFQTGAGAALMMIGAGAGLFEDSASARTGLGEDRIYRGELRLFGGDYAPAGWRLCGGEIDGIPDLRGRAAIGAGQPPAGRQYDVGGRGRAIAARRRDGGEATLSLTYLVSLRNQLAEPMFGEIRPFAFGFAPEGWELCDGRELPAPRFNALYSVIGNRFGGQGQTTFGLPDLRGRTPLHHGDGPLLAPEPFARTRDELAPGGDARRPRLHVTYCIATAGRYPLRP
jgi:microcystin-dependent protein